MNQAPKKVLFVITKGNWGGAQRYVFDLATRLSRGEFEPVVAFGQPGKLSEELPKARVRTIAIKSLQRDVSIRADIVSFFEMIRMFRRERPAVVHLNSSKAAGLGALAARIAHVPKIVFTAHGWPFLENRPLPARIIIWALSWVTALLSHRVICISNYDAKLARRMPFISKKVARIYNGIDLSEPFGPGDIVRAEFPAGSKIIGTIGELTRNKNQIALVTQAGRDPEMRVAIVGSGEDRAMLEREIAAFHLEHRVRLLGFLPAHDVMKGFDVFALPSLKEGLPYVLIEAKAAGLPIVADRTVGGIGEILDADISLFDVNRMIKETAALY